LKTLREVTADKEERRNAEYQGAKSKPPPIADRGPHPGEKWLLGNCIEKTYLRSSHKQLKDTVRSELRVEVSPDTGRPAFGRLLEGTL
jgi:hypothetical protein